MELGVCLPGLEAVSGLADNQTFGINLPNDNQREWSFPVVLAIATIMDSVFGSLQGSGFFPSHPSSLPPLPTEVFIIFLHREF